MGQRLKDPRHFPMVCLACSEDLDAPLPELHLSASEVALLHIVRVPGGLAWRGPSDMATLLCLSFPAHLLPGLGWKAVTSRPSSQSSTPGDSMSAIDQSCTSKAFRTMPSRCAVCVRWGDGPQQIATGLVTFAVSLHSSVSVSVVTFRSTGKHFSVRPWLRPPLQCMVLHRRPSRQWTPPFR